MDDLEEVRKVLDIGIRVGVEATLAFMESATGKPIPEGIVDRMVQVAIEGSRLYREQ